MTTTSLSSRRKNCVWQQSQASHAGLWFDRGIETIPPKGSDEGIFAKHTEAVTTINTSDIYKRYVNRWQQDVTQLGAKIGTASVIGRLALGLGGPSVIDTGLRLHHTYGTPMIPGSALKGLASSFAHHRIEDPQWMLGNTAHTTLFGTSDQSGCVTFFDALYEPEIGHNKQALYPDIVTVHHPEYYQGQGAAPADWDSPVPIPFLSITGTFLIALAGPDEWVKAAFEILKLALQHEGIGAKTNAGYGRMALELPKPPPPNPQEQEANQLVVELNQLPDKLVTQEINKFYTRWQKLQAPPALRKKVAQAILEKVEQAGRSKASIGKAWFEELRSFIKEQ